MHRGPGYADESAALPARSLVWSIQPLSVTRPGSLQPVTEPRDPAADPVGSPTEVFTLKAASPVRALGIAAIAALIGAVVWVFAAVADLPLVLDILGAGVLIFAVSLAVVALLLSARLRTTVRIDPHQVTVSDGSTQQTLPWADIDEVTLKGRRLTLGARADSTLDLVVRNPRAENDPTFRALLVSVQSHLDADRGYRPFV
jgi:hypothetical protein